MRVLFRSTWSTSTGGACPVPRRATTCPPAGAGSCSGPTATRRPSSPVRSPTSGARPPRPCLDGSSGARSRPRAEAQAGSSRPSSDDGGEILLDAAAGHAVGSCPLVRGGDSVEDAVGPRVDLHAGGAHLGAALHAELVGVELEAHGERGSVAAPDA